MKAAIKVIWSPILLALAAALTSLSGELNLDPVLIAGCLFITLGHFYLTGFLAAKYFRLHATSGANFWRTFAISYIPFILSFWAMFLLHVPSEYNFDFTWFNYIILGILLSGILFAIFCIKQVKMDLYAVLAILLIVGIVGFTSFVFFGWLIADFIF